MDNIECFMNRNDLKQYVAHCQLLEMALIDVTIKKHMCDLILINPKTIIGSDTALQATDLMLYLDTSLSQNQIHQ